MKRLRKGVVSAWSYYMVVCVCILGLMTIVGSGGGGGDDGGGGGDEPASYSAKGDYYVYIEGTYAELGFDVQETDMPEGYGFEEGYYYEYELGYIEDETEPYEDDQLILYVWDDELQDYTDSYEFDRVGERSDDPEQLFTVGTWEYVDEYGDTYTLTLGESTWDDYWEEFYGKCILSVSYTEEGEDEGQDWKLTPHSGTHDQH